MTLKRFATAVIELGGTIDLKGVEFNTNNAWGFGGGIGKTHAGEVKGVKFVFRKGTAYFRHLDPEPFANISVPGEASRLTPESFLKRFESVTLSSK